MARPKKEGLDYFPLDVAFFADKKVRLVKGENGFIAPFVLVRLLTQIYEHGYYDHFCEESAILIAEDTGATVEQVLKIVASACKWGFFEKGLYDKHKVLTSAGIQKRYFSGKRRDPEGDYLVIAAKTQVSATETLVNAGESTQSKVKESIVENSIVDNPPTPSTGEEILPSEPETPKITKKSRNTAKSVDQFTLPPKWGAVSKDALQRWIDYKNARREALLVQSIEAQIEHYRDDPKQFVAAVNFTIRKTWQGLADDPDFQKPHSGPGHGIVSKSALIQQKSFENAKALLEEEDYETA
jgi:hypothetical protein